MVIRWEQWETTCFWILPVSDGPRKDPGEAWVPRDVPRDLS